MSLSFLMPTVIERTASSRAICESKPGRHSRCVLALLAAIIAMSGIDLALTLSHMANGGMFENNPLVAGLVRLTNSSLALAGFKVLTAAITVALLFHIRRRPQALIGAITATLILAAVMVMWRDYIAAVDGVSLLEVASSQEGLVQIH